MNMTQPTILPNHLGFILDGNRRWADDNGVPTLEGHRVGYDSLKRIGEEALKRGIKFVSAFIFSTENWNRAPAEVKYLMKLAYKLLTQDVEWLNKKNIKVVWLGSAERVSKKLQQAIKNAETNTRNNTGGTLCLCFNYGGQQEIVDAARKLIEQGVNAVNLTEKVFEKALYHPEIPAIDLLIRTSGEMRISNFMLWRSAYAELYFTDKNWPAFDAKDLDDALEEYAKRQRRFGA